MRVDSHIYANYFVPPNYDSMIGKIIVHGDTREQALARMSTALAETVVEGINTNIPLHRELMVDAKFMDGGTNIHYLEEWLSSVRAEALPGRVMSLFELILLAPVDEVETLSEALDALDALSVSVEDADAQTPAEQALFGEPDMPPPKAGWERSRVDRAVCHRGPGARRRRRCWRPRTFRGLPRGRHPAGARAGLGAPDAVPVRAGRDHA